MPNTTGSTAPDPYAQLAALYNQVLTENAQPVPTMQYQPSGSGSGSGIAVWGGLILAAAGIVLGWYWWKHRHKESRGG